MGAAGSKEDELRREEIEELEEQTGFTGDQVLELYKRFRKLDTEAHGTITRSELLRIPELSMNPIVERVLARLHFSETSRINFTDFLNILAVFRPKSDPKDRLRVLFDVFDEDSQGLISRENIISVLKSMVGTQLTTEEIEGIVDAVVEDMDADKDGRISFEDFSARLLHGGLPDKMTVPVWHSDDDEVDGYKAVA
ncbi:Calcineurin subunit B [Hondaea fermentalgiana]|uniref:Calcineurin subunit B n=1 Tax=Hondaea fermentalgiana TaxID=2315210 RepID=A0A2R5G6W7_9STRA|nr:Calcineurin subunit B [Hondaea fermentalgiana]|eukprot:GBG26796.1 Calcineurin subunit B [Hondaea fermentalgiana]